MIDCFLFHNEFELLEIRLNTLSPYVDKFVLCECPITHSGNTKPLFFDENKYKFRSFNITHLIAYGCTKQDWLGSWYVERYQREYLINGIKDASPNEMILLSDIDEIPNLNSQSCRNEGSFICKLYYYYFNCFTGRNNWFGTAAIKKKNITNFNNVRDDRHGYNVAGNGWHFSTLGSAQAIKHKIESFAHVEFNTDEFKDKIEENQSKLVDPYNRITDKFVIQDPSGPKWLLENRDKYPHLWFREKEVING